MHTKTGSLHSRFFVVKTSFGHISFVEQSKRDISVTVFYNIFTTFYGPSEKCKALYSANCMVSIGNFRHLICSSAELGKNGSFTESLSSVDLGYRLTLQTIYVFPKKI